MKKKSWILMVVLAVVIVLAAVLYPRLTKKYGEPEIALPRQGETVKVDEKDAAGDGDAAGDKDTKDAAVANSEKTDKAAVANAGETENAAKANSEEEEKQGATEETRPEAPAAPDFSVNDSDGDEVKFSEIYGDRPMILNFWASWCGPCRSEMPAFQKIYEDYKDRVDFAFVNMTDGQRETRDLAQDFLDKGDYSFPVYFDEAQSAAYTYAVRSLPTTVVINGEGKLEGIIPGAISEQPFRDFLDAWLDDMDGAEAEKAA